MTVKCQANGVRLEVVTIPIGRRELEARAETIEPDTELWTSREKRKRGVYVEPDPDHVVHCQERYGHRHKFGKPPAEDFEEREEDD